MSKAMPKEQKKLETNSKIWLEITQNRMLYLKNM